MKKNVENFLKGKDYKILLNQEKRAWQLSNGNCYHLTKGKIKPISIRELIERGFIFQSETGLTRGWSGYIPKKSDFSDTDEEKNASLEDEMGRFWNGKIVNKFNWPACMSPIFNKK